MQTSILTVAGSDSCAGAGIQIDIKVAASLGVHACCAITAITAQNTNGVSSIEPLSTQLVAEQMRQIADDIPPAAVKIGMIPNAEVANAVTDVLSSWPQIPVVLDPVLVATSGASLSESSDPWGVLQPLVANSILITPNIPEAQTLSRIQISDENTAQLAASKLMEHGCDSVLIKGGHGNNSECIDLLFMRSAHGDALLIDRLSSPRIPGEFHGTGCSLSTAIACNLAIGMPLEKAVSAAHSHIAKILAYPTGLGHGSNIINPFVNIEQK